MGYLFQAAVIMLSGLSVEAYHFSAIELLGAILLFIVVTPFLHIIPHGEIIKAVLFTVLLLSAVIVTAASRKTLIIAAILALPAFLGKWANYFWPDVIPAEVYLTAAIVFVAFVVLNLLRFILTARQVDINVLATAVSTYLMVALLWMFVYVLLMQVGPGSLNIPANALSEGSADSFDALYFSFVTLCTLGYGDITPLSRVARMFSILEATTGTFYVAIVISRLVALYSSGSREQRIS